MRRRFFALVVCAALGVSVSVSAQEPGEDAAPEMVRERVWPSFARKVTALEVALEARDVAAFEAASDQVTSGMRRFVENAEVGLEMIMCGDCAARKAQLRDMKAVYARMKALSKGDERTRWARAAQALEVTREFIAVFERELPAPLDPNDIDGPEEW